MKKCYELSELFGAQCLVKFRLDGRKKSFQTHPEYGFVEVRRCRSRIDTRRCTSAAPLNNKSERNRHRKAQTLMDCCRL